MSRDPVLLKGFTEQTDFDIHTHTASKIYCMISFQKEKKIHFLTFYFKCFVQILSYIHIAKPPSLVTPDERASCKHIVFGILYGMGIIFSFQTY